MFARTFLVLKSYQCWNCNNLLLSLFANRIHHANVRGDGSCHVSSHHHVNVRDGYLTMARFLFHGYAHVNHLLHGYVHVNLHLHVNVHDQLRRVGK